MTVQEWSIVIGVVVSGLLALGPWMFMVHAKLANISEQIEDLPQRLPGWHPVITRLRIDVERLRATLARLGDHPAILAEGGTDDVDRCHRALNRLQAEVLELKAASRLEEPEDETHDGP